MKSFSVCALLAAAANAIPVHEAGPLAGYHHHHHHDHDHAKRALVWVTQTNVDTVILDVTKTIWADSPAASTHQAYQTQGHGVQSHSSAVSPASLAPVAHSSSSSTSSSSTSSTSTTSVYVAPTTSSTSNVVAPVTHSSSAQSVYVPSSTAAATTTTSSSTGTGAGSGTYPTSSGSSYSGDFTWYDTGVGACGKTSTSSEAIVAMAAEIWDYWLKESGTANPNNNPLCGKTVSLVGADGQRHSATIVDRCPGCAPGALDLSHGLFQTVTGQSDGRIPNSKWAFA